MDFLSKILPGTGIYVLTGVTPDGKVFNRHYKTIEALHKAAVFMDGKGVTVYHACASYKTDENRKAENAGWMRSLWLDVDVDKPNDAASYDTQKEAMAAIVAMLKALNLPAPMIVSSGMGFHLYWVFDRDVEKDEWKQLASRFKIALDAVGFKQDPTRTRDVSSVLRPVGSTWRKNGEERQVTLLRDAPAYSFDTLLVKLQQYAEPERSAASSLFAASDDLGTIEYPPSSALQVIKFCPALAEVAEARGAVSEPLWRAMIGVVKNCTEGEDLCHEWSKGDDRYSYNDTQRKIDGWTSGPATCSYFSDHSSHCAGCKHNGKIKSPIQLGVDAETEQEVNVSVEAVSEDSTEIEIVAPTFETDATKIKLPHGWWWNQQALCELLTDENGATVPVPFCNQMFYPVTRIRNVDGTYSIKMRRQVYTGVWREFDIPTECLSQKALLLRALATHEILALNKKGEDRMQDYMKAYIDTLRNNRAETAVYDSFGWHDGNTRFVLGGVAVTGNGEIPVDLADGTGHNSGGDSLPHHSAGTVDSWVAGVDELFNVEGAEAAQFAICAAFASPLVALMGIEGWHGIPLGFSGESGTGKTSVCKVALSVYGPPGAYTFQAGQSQSTDNARITMLGKYKNLPLLYDEITGVDGKVLSDLLYAAASGRSKLRLDQKGNITPQSKMRWNMLTFMTSQTPFEQVLLTAKQQEVSTATQLRVFYVDTNKDAGWNFVRDDEKLTQLLCGSYGVVGRLHLQYLTKNVEDVRKRATKHVMKYTGKAMEEDERYYRRDIATVMMGGVIAKAQGFINFDLNRVQKWAEDHVHVLRGKRLDVTYTAEEYLNKMLASFNGRIIETRELRDGRSGTPEQPLNNLSGSPVGRFVKDQERPRLILTRMAVSDWCTENKVSGAWLLSELTEKGYIHVNPKGVKRYVTGERFVIGVGTTVATSQARCIEFNTAKLSGMKSPAEEADVVELAK